MTAITFTIIVKSLNWKTNSRIPGMCSLIFAKIEGSGIDCSTKAQCWGILWWTSSTQDVVRSLSILQSGVRACLYRDLPLINSMCGHSYSRIVGGEQVLRLEKHCLPLGIILGHDPSDGSGDICWASWGQTGKWNKDCLPRQERGPVG